MVDFVVDLLDRPVALNAMGETVRIDDRDAIEGAAEEGPDLLRSQDLQERLIVSMSNPIVLAAPGLGGELTRQSGGLALDMDSMQVHGDVQASMQEVLRSGSLLGASLAVLGDLSLPADMLNSSSNNSLSADYGASMSVRGSFTPLSAMQRRLSNSKSGSDRHAYTVIAAGAPGAGARKEGAVILLWLQASPALQKMHAVQGQAAIDSTMMYSRSQPGTILDRIPTVIA